MVSTFLILILVFALGLALNLAPSGFSGWPVALILILVAVLLLPKSGV